MRVLDTKTLDQYSQEAAAWWLADKSPWDREFLTKEFYNFTFKDEFDYLVTGVASNLAGPAKKTFDAMIAQLKKKEERKDDVWHKLLADKLAVDPYGEHIPDKIGSTVVAMRIVGKRANIHGYVKNAYWPIYAGEKEERKAASGVADSLPSEDN